MKEESPPVVTATKDGVLIDVRVIPRAGSSGFGGTRHGAVLVRLKAPPVEGAANEELIELIAKTLHVPRRAVTLISGERSRQKRVLVRGVTAAEVIERTGSLPR